MNLVLGSAGVCHVSAIFTFVSVQPFFLSIAQDQILVAIRGHNLLAQKKLWSKETPCYHGCSAYIFSIKTKHTHC